MLLISLVFLPSALASTAGANAQVTLYSDAGFRGRAISVDGPVADLGRTPIGNDRASAIDVGPECTAILYRDVDFRGPAVEVRGAVANLGHTAIGNDRASSIDVRCADRWRRGGWDARDRYDDRRADWRHRDDDDRDYRRGDRGYRRADRRHRGVVLYRDTGFRAPRLEVLGSVAELARTPLGNDRLSSLSVPPGCTVVLYEDSHFRGRAIEVRHDIADLGATRIGNDRVSSIDVRCR